MRELETLGIKLIDMVVCNLHSLQQVIARGSGLQSILEQIDIGGPNIIRAAEKNFENVVVIVNPEKYEQVYQELKNDG